MPACLYLHYEEAEPAYTLKLPLSSDLTVAQAVERFASAYAKTGSTLEAQALQLSTEEGRLLAPSAVLPCGIPGGSDVFVAGAKPVQGAAPIQVPAAQSGTSEEEARQQGVYAREGSAVAASQSKMGENSYYYSVGKNRGTTGTSEPIKPDLRAVTAAKTTVREETLPSYSILDEEALVKVYIPFVGAGVLPAGSIVTTFRQRSFDLCVTSEGKVQRLHVPILLEEIDPQRCAVKQKAGKLILVLAKLDTGKCWWELRKTKGIGETGFHAIIPDAGEPHVVTV
tara:strand:+ start:193 stop:1041 length:849 start_codon:yes stop_codon:yes gene_type:complete